MGCGHYRSLTPYVRSAFVCQEIQILISNCWKYHDIGSTNSGYSVLHVQSGRFFRSNNDYTVQQRDSNTCYLFWNQYEQYQGETRRRGDMVSATSR